MWLQFKVTQNAKNWDFRLPLRRYLSFCRNLKTLSVILSKFLNGPLLLPSPKPSSPLGQAYLCDITLPPLLPLKLKVFDRFLSNFWLKLLDKTDFCLLNVFPWTTRTQFAYQNAIFIVHQYHLPSITLKNLAKKFLVDAAEKEFYLARFYSIYNWILQNLCMHTLKARDTIKLQYKNCDRNLLHRYCVLLLMILIKIVIEFSFYMWLVWLAMIPSLI